MGKSFHFCQHQFLLFNKTITHVIPKLSFSQIVFDPESQQTILSIFRKIHFLDHSLETSYIIENAAQPN